MYSAEKGVALLVGCAGLVALASHLLSQLQYGAASSFTMIGGAIAAVLGAHFYLLGDIGERVSKRIN